MWVSQVVSFDLFTFFDFLLLLQVVARFFFALSRGYGAYLEAGRTGRCSDEV